MPETTPQVDIPADPCEAAMDAAAAELSGLNLLDAADHAWQSLVAITGGSQIDNVDRHRAIVALACQVKPLRDHLIVQAVQHGDLSLPATREVVWLALKARPELQPALAGAAGMLLLAVTGSTVAAAHYARLGSQDSLGQLVAQLVEAEILPEDVKSMLLQAKPAVRRVLEDLSQPLGAAR